MSRLVIVALFVSLVALGVVLISQPAQAQESATCDQYECEDKTPTPEDASESAVCDQYECEDELPITEDEPETVPSPEDVNVDSPVIPDEIPAPEVVPVPETAPSTDTEVIVEETDAQFAEELENAEVSTEQVVVEEIEESASKTEASVSEEKSFAFEEAQTAATGKGYPLEPYPYEGEECETNDCGLGFPEPTCAEYETASGETVIGCWSEDYQEEDCYEVRWFRTDSQEYANLDTCSGERPYAPPEPPKGDFDYWEPQKETHNGYRGTTGCRDINGKLMDRHCGLEGVPDRYSSCEVFLDTAYGTVRGCSDSRENGGWSPGLVGCGNVVAYDEAGRLLGKFSYCPKQISERPCGETKCGMSSEVPENWDCSTRELIAGELYGGERETVVRCVHPRYEEYREERPPEARAKVCVKYFDERGNLLTRYGCAPEGFGEIGESAHNDAEQADETLGDDSDSPNTNDSTSTAGTNAPSELNETATNAENWTGLGDQATYGDGLQQFAAEPDFEQAASLTYSSMIKYQMLEALRNDRSVVSRNALVALAGARGAIEQIREVFTSTGTSTDAAQPNNGLLAESFPQDVREIEAQSVERGAVEAAPKSTGNFNDELRQDSPTAGKSSTSTSFSQHRAVPEVDEDAFDLRLGYFVPVAALAVAAATGALYRRFFR